MNDNYAKNLKSFFINRQEDSLRQLRVENTEYIDLRASHDKDCGRMNEILSRLSPEDSEFANKYINEIYDVTCYEMDQLYIQGYKDCFRILCFLNVLEVKL